MFERSGFKKPAASFRRGLNSCDDEYMPVICPAAQVLFSSAQPMTDRDFVSPISSRIYFAPEPCYSFGRHCLSYWSARRLERI
jgi:hypothetical protein